MPLRKTRERRAAHRAELERQDPEHPARLAAVSAEAARLPLPGLSTVAMDGRCPHCQESSFTVPGLAAPMATAAFLASDTAEAVIGAAAGAASSSYVILCVTCGERFRRG